MATNFEIASLKNGEIQVDNQVANDRLDQLIAMVEEFLPVTPVQYPELRESNGEPVANFCVRHSALHFSKTAGQLAAIAEAMDHGEHLEQTSLRKVAINSLINSCKLASEIGISSRELVDGINRKFSR